MNEEIAIIYNKRCAAQAVLLFWKKRFLSMSSIIWRSIISLFCVFCLTYPKITLTGLVASFVALILFWGMLAVNYFIILFRILGQMRPTFGRTIKHVLHDDRIFMSSDREAKEVFWSDLDMYAKSSEVTLFYSSKTKELTFFPNAMLSEKVQAYMLEKFNEAVTELLNERLKPPIIASAAALRRKYVAAIIVILALAAAMLIGHRNYSYLHPALNGSVETNNIVQH